MQKHVACALFTLLLVTLPLRAEDSVPSISTTGSAIVYATPDKVVVTVGVQSFASDLDRSKEENQKAAERLVAAIKALGIAETDIGTDRLSVDVQYKDTRTSVD